jgi:hypothetical protein
MTWLVVALVAVALIAIGAYVMGRRRSAALRRRFGPDYERALSEAGGDRRAAETQLRERLRRRAVVEVHDLEPAGRARYETRWRVVQIGFVDDPARAVGGAEALLNELVAELGYVPTGPADEDEADRYELVAVDHPTLVEGVRTARRADPESPVDDLRAAFLQYRALFGELLRAGSGPDEDGEVREGRRRRRFRARRHDDAEAAVVRS